MWIYEKKLLYPCSIKKTDVRIAKALCAMYGGPDSELGMAARYLSQRYTMPDDRCKALLTDIATEELAHWEMLGAMIRQCLKRAPIAQIKAAGMEGYFLEHGLGVGGAPVGAPLAATGDPIADITENMAAEQRARAAYEHILELTDDPSVKDPIRFLREREIVHFQRFGECLNLLQGHSDCRAL